jgi:hypothetical protein
MSKTHAVGAIFGAVILASCYAEDGSHCNDGVSQGRVEQTFYNYPHLAELISYSPKYDSFWMSEFIVIDKTETGGFECTAEIHGNKRSVRVFYRAEKEYAQVHRVE